MFSSLYHTQQVAAVSSLSSFAVQTPASLRCLPAYSLFTRAHAPGQEGVQEVLQRDAPPEDRARQGWDPEGLFDRGLERPGSFIAARQASKRKDRLAVAPSIAAEDQRVSLANTRSVKTPARQSRSLDIQPGPADQQIPSGADRSALAQRLAADYMPVNLDQAGLHMLHADPPIFAADNFLEAELCNAFIDTANASDLMNPSRIGAGNISGSDNEINNRRTSCSLLLDGMISMRHPKFRALMKAVQGAAWRLTDGGFGWGKIGMMPRAGQFTFESPQLARYEAAQHFLSHEDAFPSDLAATNGFQRQATVLVYLNDVQQGGATRFEHLNLAVQPRKGMALLFFPSFADGTPDDRTLHTAEAAQDTKWIMQQWIAKGWSDGTPADAPYASRPSPTNINAPSHALSKKQGKRKGAQSSRKGF